MLNKKGNSWNIASKGITRADRITLVDLLVLDRKEAGVEDGGSRIRPLRSSRQVLVMAWARVIQRSGEKWSDSVCILMEEPVRFADEFDVGV